MEKSPVPASLKEKLSALNRAIFVQNGTEAAELYEVVLKEKPDFQLRGPVQFDLAQLLEKTPHRDLALLAYETIIEHQADNKALLPAMRAGGMLAFELKKFDKCMKYLTEFLKSKPPMGERQEAEEILSRLPPDQQKKRADADGAIQVDRIPSSSWSIGETPKPVTFEWKVESKKTPQPGRATPKPVAPAPEAEGDGIAIEGFLSPAAPNPLLPQVPSPAMPARDLPRPLTPKPVAPARGPNLTKPSTERPAAVRVVMGEQQAAEPLPPTQQSSLAMPALPTEPEGVNVPGATPMATPPPMPAPFYPQAPPPGFPAGPSGWYPPPGQPGYPPGAYPHPAAYGVPPGYPAPPPGYYPHPHSAPPAAPYPPLAPPQMPPPAQPVLPSTVPTAIPSSAAYPPVTATSIAGTPCGESPEQRLDRLRDERFALLIPIGKKIHLEAVADFVGRYEGVSEAAAKKKVLKGKGLLYSELTLNDVVAMHPAVKLCRQSLVLVAIPRGLKSVEAVNVLKAERRDKGIKMTTEGAVRRMRWEEIRLVNCGLIGNELMAVISGGDPMADFRFRASSFDYAGFASSGSTNFQAAIVEFLEIICAGAPKAVRSHIVEGLLQRKFTAPQPFSGWNEWDSYCDWVLYSHFAEKIDMEELVELSQTSSNW